MATLFLLEDLHYYGGNNEYFETIARTYHDNDIDCPDMWKIDCTYNCGYSSEAQGSYNDVNWALVNASINYDYIIVSDNFYNKYKDEINWHIEYQKTTIYKLTSLNNVGGNCYEINYTKLNGGNEDNTLLYIGIVFTALIAGAYIVSSSKHKK